MSSTTSAPPTHQVRRSKPSARTIVVSLLLVFGIVGGAWYLVGAQGFDELGKGGVNQALLPKPGEPAPDIVVSDILGNRIALSSLRGKTVWINFWGSWCPPCRAEMPEIQEAYTRLAGDDFVLMAISLKEDPRVAALYAARNDATFPIFTDQFMIDTGAAYPIYNFPTHIFIDPDGIVRHVVLSEMTADEAVAYVEQTANGA